MEIKIEIALTELDLLSLKECTNCIAGNNLLPLYHKIITSVSEKVDEMENNSIMFRDLLQHLIDQDIQETNEPKFSLYPDSEIDKDIPTVTDKKAEKKK